MELMKIGKKNYIKQLRLHNEKALAEMIEKEVNSEVENWTKYRLLLR